LDSRDDATLLGWFDFFPTRFSVGAGKIIARRSQRRRIILPQLGCSICAFCLICSRESRDESLIVRLFVVRVAPEIDCEPVDGEAFGRSRR
jgi:hypothetical protein